MKYTIIPLGTLKVDAFEMIIGVSEKNIRDRYDVDTENVMRISMNGLIVETGEKVVFFDPGCATFLSRELAETYDLQMELTLEESVAASGYTIDTITDVVFTHLHFDHGSGAFKRIPGGIVKAFPNANYVVSKSQLDNMQMLDREESSSYFHKLLKFIGEPFYAEDWSAEGISFRLSHGHTSHMLVPVIDLGDRDLLYATDLVPMKLQLMDGAWSYYDADKDLLQKERGEILSSIRPGSEIIYYHDPKIDSEPVT